MYRAIAARPMNADRVASTDDIVAHIPALLATARFLVASEAEARDLTQATVEIALAKLASLRDPSKLRAWLLTIEAREASRLRRQLRRVVSLDLAVRQVSAGGMPDERGLDVRAAVRRLPNRMRTAVVLHFMAGFSVAETASAMAVKENTVKTELQGALRRLREEL
jgi:RNA polymerase sigma-70 factor (ECF subfamily)